MPELVGSRASRINPRPSERVSYNGADSTLTLETSCGRFRPEKHASTAGSWPSVPQIISDGRADIDRQWQLRIPASLPAHCNQSLLPIQIFQREHSDLTGAQTQARQDQENCIVGPAHTPRDPSQCLLDNVRTPETIAARSSSTGPAYSEWRPHGAARIQLHPRHKGKRGRLVRRRNTPSETHGRRSDSSSGLSGRVHVPAASRDEIGSAFAPPVSLPTILAPQSHPAVPTDPPAGVKPINHFPWAVVAVLAREGTAETAQR